jgi:RNA polymerase sigma-70 factor (ECF subfamily)
MAIGGGRAEPVEITAARFDAWYEALRAPLRAYLRRVTRNAVEADDLFQEAWIRLLTHPPRTLDPAGVRAYLFTIATHLARDAWRHDSWIARWIHTRLRQDEREPSRDDALEAIGDAAPDPAALYEAREEVARSFRSLTPREHALLWLAHVEQYDHREIAAMLGIRAASVRVLLHRARQRALTTLRAHEPKRGRLP